MFAQKESLDYGETFAPTGRLETFRLVLVLAAQRDSHLGQLVVKSAFKHAKIDEEVYIEQPEGYHEKAEDGTKLGCKQNKSIYGLKQASKNWYDRLKNFLVDESFEQSKREYSLYVKREPGKTIYVLVWIYDVLVASSSLKQVQELEQI